MIGGGVVEAEDKCPEGVELTVADIVELREKRNLSRLKP